MNKDEKLYRGIAHLASARVANGLNESMVPGGVDNETLDRQEYGEDVAIATLAAAMGISARIIRAAIDDMEDALRGL